MGTQSKIFITKSVEKPKLDYYIIQLKKYKINYKKIKDNILHQILKIMQVNCLFRQHISGMKTAITQS